MSKLQPIKWSHGITPEDADRNTPHFDRREYHRVWQRDHYVPAPKKMYRVSYRSNREVINISLKPDISYEEYLDAWVEVQNAIIERQKREL